MPEISVIMPVYNTAPYLRKSIESVLNQTYADFELIAVDDGSTDDSLNILNEYAAKDKRIKVLTQPNSGQSIARNNALRVANGKYIAFIDSDDFYVLNFLQILHQVAEETNVDVVCCDFQKIYKESDNIREIDASDVRYKVYNNPLRKTTQKKIFRVAVWNKLYRAEFVKNRLFIEGIRFEDLPWTMNLMADISSYAEVPYQLYGYNSYNSSTMRSTFTKLKMNNYLTAIHFIADLFRQEKYRNDWRFIQKTHLTSAIKMMINLVYHEKKHQPELNQYLLKILKKLHKEKIFYYRDLPLKMLVRITKIWFKNNLSITDTARHKVIKIFGLTLKIRQVKGRRGAEYYYLKQAKKKQRKYPKDTYLLFDSLHDVSAELVDAYTLFRYMRSVGLKAYYVIWKKNPLYQKLLETNDLENVIALSFPTSTHPNEMAKKIQDVLARTKMVITSYSAYSGTMNGFFKKNKYMKYIFIQHGVIFLKESILYNNYLQESKFDKILVSSQTEHDILLRYNFPDEKILISGLPRWDLLKMQKNTQEKSILLMLTWRRLKPEIFDKSLYCQNLKKLLSNSRLQKCLAQNHVSLYFAPHHNLKFSTSSEWHLEGNNVEVIDSCAISQYVKKCSALITDFSSVAFDFMFQHKPVLFYVLDKGDTLLHHYDREDIERFEEKKKILPNVYFDEEKVVNAVIEMIKNNFAIDDKTAQTYDRFFAVKENICENLTKQLEEM